jgi:hypothetical protein
LCNLNVNIKVKIKRRNVVRVAEKTKILGKLRGGMRTAVVDLTFRPYFLKSNLRYILL